MRSAVLPTLDLEHRGALSSCVVERLTVFVCYDPRDADWKDRLIQHLCVPAQNVLGDDGSGRATAGSAGAAWRDEVNRAVESANVVLLLLSASFLSSTILRQEV